MGTTWRDKLLVASIDFGTTYSGYAVSFRHNYTPDNPVILTQQWKCGDTPSTSKTPTCVLLDPQERFHSFGYEAENKYAALAEDNKHKEWHLFRRFKMLLYKDKELRGLNMTDNIKDTRGRAFPAINIFSYAINYMKDQIFAFVRDKSPEIKEDDFYFVLTTPAIWSEQAKAFMRKAAKNAKIKDDHLRIALEPECAAVYLHRKDLPALDQMSRTKMAMKPGSCHVIADLGGGTVDIAAHRVGDDCKFEEVIPPCGGPCGSDNINMAFENFVIKMSGGPVFHSFKNESMEDYLYLQRTFENKKCLFSEIYEDCPKVTMVFPESFRVLHEQHNNEDLTFSVRQMDMSQDVEFKPGKMKIGNNMFMQFFEPTIDDVIHAIREALNKIPCRIDTLCCVGGFSDCYILKKTIKERFPDMTVVIPPDAVSTVMKGAVMFGRDQSSVNKRICPYTIGLDWNEDYDSKNHPKDKLRETDEGKICIDVFKILIKKGDLIQYDASSREIDAYTTYKYQPELTFPFYRSETLKDPKFVTDIGCHLIGSMKINISDHLQSGQQHKHVSLRVFFGSTELTAEATDDSGRKHEVVFSFAETQV